MAIQFTNPALLGCAVAVPAMDLDRDLDRDVDRKDDSVRAGDRDRERDRDAAFAEIDLDGDQTLPRGEDVDDPIGMAAM
jgi:hypothetical protein